MIGKTNVLSLPGEKLIIAVAIESGAVVTATKGGLTISGISENGMCILTVPEPGVWTVQGSKDGYTTLPYDVEVKIDYPISSAFYIATITVSVEAGATVTLHRDGAAIAEKLSTGTAVFTVDRMGTYTVSATRDGQSSDTATIHAVAGTTAYAASLTFFAATITVTIDSGSTVTCAGNGDTQTKISDDTGTAVFIVRAVGGYTITATLNDQETSDTVMISENGQSVTVELTYAVFIYTGDYTETEIEVDGVAHKLYTLTSSGTLTLKEQARVWACGSGAGGYSCSSSSYERGNGGGGGYVLSDTEVAAGDYNVTIAAGGAPSTAGAATSIGELTADGGGTTLLQDGGSGGGSGGMSVSRIGKGAGIPTYPFGIEALFAHCAGGGGGYEIIYYANGLGFTYGGDGGSNGANGANGGYDSDPSRCLGGEKGGGTGGLADRTEGTAATFYGSGGGGGFYYRNNGNTSLSGYTKGGAGYQGVAYVLMPTA